MTDTWRKGWALLVHSLNVFAAYPSLLLPILFVWACYAPTVLYLRFSYPWALHTSAGNLAMIFLCIVALSFLLLVSCDVVLHMVRQLEDGPPSIARALETALAKDTLRIVPLALAWAVVWFLLLIVQVLLSRKREGDEDVEVTAADAAAVIAGYGDLSFSAAFIQALQKGLRMVMFLVMPAIAWEGLGVVEASKKALAVLEAHLGDFARGYAVTYAGAAVAFLPAAIIFELGGRHHGHAPLIHFPDGVWVGVTIYVGLVWSLCIYLEQLFMAQLYLWYMAWDRAATVAIRKDMDPPGFSDVPRPELLAKTPGLFA